MDALEPLIQDHRTVDELFDRFEETSDPAHRREQAGKMTEVLSIHATIEERELSPLMRRAFDEDDSRPARRARARRGEGALCVLAQLQADDERFEAIRAHLRRAPPRRGRGGGELELYEFAQKIGLEGRSDLTKDELVRALAP